MFPPYAERRQSLGQQMLRKRNGGQKWVKVRSARDSALERSVNFTIELYIIYMYICINLLSNLVKYIPVSSQIERFDCIRKNYCILTISAVG